MSLKKIRLFLFVVGIITIASVEIAFSPPQDQIFTIDGRATFNFSKYPNQKVNVGVTEDGKPFKTVYSDDRGNFTVNIFLNHRYMFNMSMDYHATSKVSIDTHVPEIVANTGVGGFFEFKCPLFELYEGLNTGILNRPLMKMKYLPKKDKFEFDKEYSENMRYDLEGFLARSEQLEIQNKRVLKAVKQSATKKEVGKGAVAVRPEKENKERKVIEFEAEKENKVAVNKRGHRNIMEVANETEVSADEDLNNEDQLNLSGTPESVNITEDNEDKYAALNVAPKRILIEQKESGDKKEETQSKIIEEEKMKVRQEQGITRMEEETKIRDEVRSLNHLAIIQREKRMINQKIQADRLRELIKTIAIAEIYVKKEYYRQFPINHNEIIPSVVVQKTETWLVDQEKIMIRYPNESITFKKESYPFGITYYYIGEKEIDKAGFCGSIDVFSKNNYTCIN